MSHYVITKLTRFLREEDGPTAVEYAIMLALILAVVIGAVTLVGTETNTFYEGVGESMETINNGGDV